MSDAFTGLASGHPLAATKNEPGHQNHGCYEQENLGKAGGKTCYAAKAQKRRDKCDNGKNDGPAKNGSLLK